MATTTYHFTGPTTRRQLKGACPDCGRKVTRSRTFEMTVNPFNRNKTTGEMKTWDEVAADLQAEADAWQPNFTCKPCRDAEELNAATMDTLIHWIRGDADERDDLRWHGKHSRADLCNQRIAVYEARVLALDPERLDWPVSNYYDRDITTFRSCCYHEFPDRQRCVLSARHGAGYHLSPTGDKAVIGASR